MADPFGIFVQVMINESELFGIFVILALSLNLEFGFTGIPNFGKVFFFGLGSFVTGATVAHLSSLWIGLGNDICSATSYTVRGNFGFSNPGVQGGLFLLSFIVSAVITGAFGYLLSYPTLRLREDYLGIMLIAVGYMLQTFVRALPSNVINCETNTLSSITSPFLFLNNFAPPSTGPWPAPFQWVNGTILVEGPFAVVCLLTALACYIIVSKLTKSPFGRMLKSVRDDEPAAVSLGKDPAKVRGQVMIIGSAMAGVAGTLFAFQLQGVNSDSFVPLYTFIVWMILLLGGAANNRGILLGAVAYLGIFEGVFLGRSWAATTFPQFHAILAASGIDLYSQQLLLGAIVILVIMFRPQGILREKPIKTPAWEVLEDSTDSENKQPK